MKSSLLEQNPEASKLSAVEVSTTPHLPSYQPTKWAIVNQILDFADNITHGRAGWCQRFFTFAFIGGIAALINIAVFYTVFDVIALPVAETLHNVIASAFAAEISIMANFALNDFFTFRHLAGHERTWLARCLRFQLTALGGTALTFVIEFSLSHALPVRPIFAQAIALILVLFYNFSFHHIFTYRQVKPANSRV